MIVLTSFPTTKLEKKIKNLKQSISSEQRMHTNLLVILVGFTFFFEKALKTLPLNKTKRANFMMKMRTSTPLDVPRACLSSGHAKVYYDG